MKHTTKLLSIFAVTLMLLAFVGCQPNTGCTHSYTTSTTEATCTSKGYTLHTCEICGDSYKTDETPALGHDYVDTVVVPTCTAKGYTKHTCSRCNDTYNDTEVNALGHTWVIDKEATCTTNGEKHCSVCNTVEVINAHHTWEVVSTTEATCTTAKVNHCKCTECTATTDMTISNALGHNYEGGVCKVCENHEHCECVGSKDCTTHDFIIYICTAYGQTESEMTKLVFCMKESEKENVTYGDIPSMLTKKGINKSIKEYCYEVVDYNDGLMYSFEEVDKTKKVPSPLYIILDNE